MEGACRVAANGFPIQIDKKSPIPIYFQIQRELIALFDSGVLQPGDMLPSENEFSRQFGISPMTVRQAMSELVQQGYIKRERGRGTFVAPRHLEHTLDRLVSFSEDMTARDLTPGARVLLIEDAIAPPEVVVQAGLPPSTIMLRLKRLRLANDKPVGIHDAYLHRIRLTESDLEETPSLYALLAQRDIVVAEGLDKIEAVAATREAADLLHVKAGAPLLQTTRRSWDTRGVLVEYIVALYRADLYHYQIRLRRS